MKASTEETINLLSLLEKDIANSLQEWNDILPGAANIEVVYALLDEKENELNTAIQEKEELNKRLTHEKQFQPGEKERLQNDYEKMKKRVSELTQEVSRLQTQAVKTSEYSGYTVQGGRGLTGSVYEPSEGRVLGLGDVKLCTLCGKPYIQKASGDIGICDDCKRRPDNA